MEHSLKHIYIKMKTKQNTFFSSGEWRNHIIISYNLIVRTLNIVSVTPVQRSSETLVSGSSSTSLFTIKLASWGFVWDLFADLFIYFLLIFCWPGGFCAFMWMKHGGVRWQQGLVAILNHFGIVPKEGHCLLFIWLIFLVVVRKQLVSVF